MNNLVNNYTTQAVAYLESASLKYRKSLGQYFTPKSICIETIEELKKYIDINKSIKVLEPSAGSGEFIKVVKDNFSKAKIDAFEIDKKLCKILSSEYKSKSINIENTDTLTKTPEPKYDLVIGNPPYFETKLDRETKSRFEEVIKGRVNIFSLFIKIGLDYLNDGGYLAYVLPSSIKSGAYFSALREYILKHSSIEYMKLIENNYSFHSANQSVIILILKKCGSNKTKYVFTRDSIKIFSENYKELKDFYSDKLSLKDLGYNVKTGSIVWNQNKNKLTNKKDNNTKVLVYSSNIQNSNLLLNTKKNKYPQYIKTNIQDKAPAILINRIIGSVNNSNIRSTLIDKDYEYVGENHINIVYEEKLVDSRYSLNYIKKCLDKKENIKTMLSIIGNTQISRKELFLLLPIDKI